MSTPATKGAHKGSVMQRLLSLLRRILDWQFRLLDRFMGWGADLLSYTPPERPLVWYQTRRGPRYGRLIRTLHDGRAIIQHRGRAGRYTVRRQSHKIIYATTEDIRR